MATLANPEAAVHVSRRQPHLLVLPMHPEGQLLVAAQRGIDTVKDGRRRDKIVLVEVARQVPASREAEQQVAIKRTERDVHPSVWGRGKVAR